MNRSRWYWLLGSILLLLLLALGYIWWLPDPRLVHTFTTEHRVDEVAISPNGIYVAAAESNRDRLVPRVSVWQTTDQQLLYTLDLDCRVITMAISPDNRYLLVASGDRALGMWELVTGDFVQYLLAPQPAPAGRDRCNERYNTTDGREIYAVAFHPRDALVAVARPDGIVLLVDMHSGAVVDELQGHLNVVLATPQHQDVWDVDFSLDGTLLASVGTDGSTHIWNVEDKNLIHILQTNLVGGTYSVAFSSSDQEVAVFRQIALIERWSLATETLLSRDGLPAPPDQAVSFNTDGTIVAVGGYEVDMNPAAILLLEFDPRIYICPVQHMENCHSLQGHTDVISGLDFSADGRLLVSGSRDGTVRLWRVPTFAE
jgi:WD40 repeat protein